MSAAPITITQPEPGQWTVAVGAAFCPHLTWDEMLGQIAQLTHPKIVEARYPLLTDEQHAERQKRLYEGCEAMHARNRAEDESKRSAIGAMADALRQWQFAEQRDDGREFANAQAARDAALIEANKVGLA